MMITQKQQEERQQRAQAAFPREEKQMATPIPPPLRPASASPRRWIDVLLRILGVALAFADGFLFGWGVATLESMGSKLRWEVWNSPTVGTWLIQGNVKGQNCAPIFFRE